mmetsp:Transcript_7554/g.16436  ORF Transcript_7554/g.16436 Transcript_7554/m.16436 type:complete len:222 (+) Transcript_7554:585-1250(+)
MRQRLLRRHPLLRISFQQRQHKVHGIPTLVIPMFFSEFQIANSDRLVHVVVRGTVEGRVSAQQYVGDDADGPQVARSIVRSGEELGGHVVGCSYGVGHERLPHGIVTTGQPKINQGRTIVTGGRSEQNVLRLDIPMNNVPFVQIRHGLQQPRHHPRGPVLGITSRGGIRPLHDPIEQIPPRIFFRDDVNVVGILVVIDHVQNPLVIDALQETNLVLQMIQP